MISNGYEKTPDHANIRRIGQFGPPDVSSVVGNHPSNGGDGKEWDTRPVKEKRQLSLSREMFALLMMLAGVVLLTIGISMLFGLPWGLSTLGVTILGIGFMVALPSKPTTTE